MNELTEQELLRMEHEVEVAEHKLTRQIAEAEADALDVAETVRELHAKIEAQHQAGAASLAPWVGRLRQLSPPVVPHEQHRLRSAEVRADALRARRWLVSSMIEDLRHFTHELGDLARLVEEARAALEQAVIPRASREQTVIEPRPALIQRPRLERLRATTGDYAKTDPNPSAPRRKRPRVRLEAAIDLHSRSNFYTGFTENISDGGIFVATVETVPIGTEVELAFTLPSGHEIRGRGVVRWSRDASEGLAAGLGVQFEGLTGEARDAILSFIEAREPIFHPE